VPRIGDDVIVSVTTIQRTYGGVWRGDRGKIIGESGDGYRVKFGDLVLDNVKDREITKA